MWWGYERYCTILPAHVRRQLQSYSLHRQLSLVWPCMFIITGQLWLHHRWKMSKFFDNTQFFLFFEVIFCFQNTSKTQKNTLQKYIDIYGAKKLKHFSPRRLRNRLQDVILWENSVQIITSKQNSCRGKAEVAIFITSDATHTISK